MFKTKDLTKMALFTALVCIGAFITVPMYPVPITLQTFFVVMAGLLLSPIQAFLSVLIYILLGLVGLPVFAGFTGGVATVFKPSFGFLIGFAFAAFAISYVTKGSTNISKMILAILVGQIILYGIGLPYLQFILASLGKAPNSFYGLLKIGLIPFIPGIIVKMGLAIFIAPKIKKITDRF